MSIALNLYRLQQIDTRLDQVTSRLAAIRAALENNAALQAARLRQEQAEAALCAIKGELFDPLAPAHSGELIASALGNSFLGFALSLLVVSPLLDRIGARRVILFASACFSVGRGSGLALGWGS